MHDHHHEYDEHHQHCGQHAHDHEHCGNHNHGHDHKHDHDHGAMSKEEEFRVRITHWRDHNREHQHTLEEWGAKVLAAGHADTAAAMNKAADLLGQSVAELDKALDTLG